jgi:hypothetical protein
MSGQPIEYRGNTYAGSGINQSTLTAAYDPPSTQAQPDGRNLQYIGFSGGSDSNPIDQPQAVRADGYYGGADGRTWIPCAPAEQQQLAAQEQQRQWKDWQLRYGAQSSGYGGGYEQ